MNTRFNTHADYSVAMPTRNWRSLTLHQPSALRRRCSSLSAKNARPTVALNEAVQLEALVGAVLGEWGLQYVNYAISHDDASMAHE
jgi:hypothetical protein